MTRNRLIRSTTLILTMAFTFCGANASAQVQAQSRILSQIKNEDRVLVKGTVSPLLKNSVDTGRLPGGHNLGRMVLLLAPTAEQEQAAADYVVALHDSSSPMFHKWLTPTQFGQQFGVTSDDAAKVEQWLQTQGLTVYEVSQSHRYVVFSGTVGQVEQAFSTEMHSYTYNNKKFVANSVEMQIPAALAPAVKGVVRLHGDPRNEHSYMGGKVHFNKSTGKFEGGDGSHYMGPADFAKIYNVQPLYDAKIDGTGQTIAIVGRSNINVQDVTDFRTQLGLPANNPQVVVNGDDPGQTGDVSEAMLDVTWSGSVAPMANVILVVSQSNFADGVDISAEYIVDNNVAPVVSMSYGACENSLGTLQNEYYNALWQQAAAQGMTVFVSAGDNGGAGCDAPGGGNYAAAGLAVNGLSSTPYNVSVGGTQFDEGGNDATYWAATSDPTTGLSALGYIPEKVWNESRNDPNYVLLYAGSGGVSSVYKKPSWQAASGVPNDGWRDLPDISLTAALHDGYLVCLAGSCSSGQYFYVFGGTSASAPCAAGIMALVNQKLAGQRQGLANYVFYRLASTPGVYHDIVNGNNKVPDPLGQFTVGYDAGSGYDTASGLGSFDANALVNHWSNAASATGSTITLALAGGQASTVVHGTPMALQAKVACAGAGCAAPTGDVSLLATPATGLPVGVGAGSLSPASPISIANLSTAKVPGGNYSLTATYDGDGKYYSRTSNAVSVTVSPELSQTFLGMIGGGSWTTGPLSINYGTHQQVGIIVAGNSGAGYPTGNLSLTLDGNPVTTSAFDPATSTLTLSLLTLNFGEHSTIVAPGVNAISQSSTISYLLPSTSLGVGPHQLQATYPGDASFGSSVSNVYAYNVIKSDIFIADFFPLGTVIANVPIHLLGQTGFIDQFSYAPYTGTVTITDTTSGTPVVLGSAPLSQKYGGSYDVPVTFTTAGSHNIIVRYSGDANVNGAAGKYTLPVVTSAPGSISLSTDVTSAALSGPVTMTALVISPTGHSLAGQIVTFYDGTVSLGTALLGGTPIDEGGGSVGLTASLAVSTLSGGVHNLIAKWAGDSVITGADTTGSPVVVSIMDYTVQAQPANIIIPTGMSGSSTINVLPLGGSTQTVGFTCAAQSPDISCTFSPATVTLDGTHTGSVKITVNTRLMAANAATRKGIWGTASTLAFAGILLPFIRRKRLKTLLGMAALCAIALCGVGCGGSGNSNTAHVGTYVVNVSATGGAGTTAKVLPLVVTVTN